MDWTVLDNPDEVARTACQRILAAAEQAIKKYGKFHIVLAGGSTPEKTYELLSRESSDWKFWHIWFGDERCLPQDHPDRNSLMVDQAFTSKVPIPAEQIHIIPAEQGPVAAAENYAELLEGIIRFDMVLLGMGEDGHTASLFPNSQAMTGKKVIPIFNAPKLPSERVSLSAEMLSQCTDLMFIITGKSKTDAVSRWQSGESLPVSLINGIETTVALADRSVFSVKSHAS
jgi:6-phosphogluconolactonase